MTLTDGEEEPAAAEEDGGEDEPRLGLVGVVLVRLEEGRQDEAVHHQPEQEADSEEGDLGRAAIDDGRHAGDDHELIKNDGGERLDGVLVDLAKWHRLR